jgi:hypothetical protein
MLRSLALLALTAALLGLVLAHPAALDNIMSYLDTQFLRSLSGQRTRVDNHFIFLVKLLNTLLPVLGFAAVIRLLGLKMRPDPSSLTGLQTGRWSLMFLTLALAGSIPLVFSPRQSLFYALPSFPCYALAIALFIAPKVSMYMEQLRSRSITLRVWRTAASLMLVSVLVYSTTKIGTYNRNETLLRDIKEIGPRLRSELGLYDKQEYAVGVCRALWREWGLEAELARYFRLSFVHDDSTSAFVLADDHCADQLGAHYVRIPLPTQRYHLYKWRDDRTGSTPDN